MEKQTAKRLLIRTILVVIGVLIIGIVLAGYVEPIVSSSKNPLLIILDYTIAAFLIFVVIVCYQFGKEYVQTIREKR